MQENGPKVTVLMPVYNGEKYLCEAIESILNQTFTDFEFLIIDDGSTDRSVEIIKSYDDPRIRLEVNVSNLKLSKALNKGLDIACGEYVARMDCDDISLPDRLYKQVTFMDNHPEVGICGTWVETFGDLCGYFLRHPADPETIKAKLFFDSYLAHPTVIMRLASLNKYCLRYANLFAEDYGLWVKASFLFPLANIPEVLLKYRITSKSFGQTYEHQQRMAVLEIHKSNLARLGITNIDEKTFEIHRQIVFQPDAINSRQLITKADEWLRKLQAANRVKQCYPEISFSRLLAERWSAVCSAAQGLGYWTWDTFWQSPLSLSVELSMDDIARFKEVCGEKLEESCREDVSNRTDKQGIDVIIPVYNGAAFIKDAIISVANQTYRPNQIVVVDDGSTDDTQKIVFDCKGELSITVIYIKQDNGGLSSARNTGIMACVSQYIAFLDADDIWEPDKLRKQIQIFNQSKYKNLGVVYCDYSNIDLAGHPLDNFPCYKLDTSIQGNVSEQLLINNVIASSGSGVLIKRECFERVGVFDEVLPTCEDWDMWMRISKFYEYDYVNERLTKLRRNPNSMSKNHLQMMIGRVLVWNKIFERKWINTRVLQEIYNVLFLNVLTEEIWHEINYYMKSELLDEVVKFGSCRGTDYTINHHLKSNKPLVTVLMPVYNGCLYLHEAISSVLDQSFTDFELLVVDDGSTDDSVRVIQSFQDSRIRLLHNEKNYGLITTLNIGIENSQGCYIARMDSDDISLPDRLDRQVSFMENNPQISVCGSWVRTIGERPGEVWNYMQNSDEIKCGLLFQNQLAHPSVIMRRSILENTSLRYDAVFKHVEDYQLWVALAKDTLLSNIPEVLVEYRIHANQVSVKHQLEQMINAGIIQFNQIRALGIKPTVQEMRVHSLLGTRTLQGNLAFIKLVREWFLKLEAANKIVGYYPEPMFIQALCRNWDSICSSFEQ